MAKECRDAIGAINLVKGQNLNRRTINQLEDATKHLTHVAVFLTNLEELHPTNGISGHLRPLFLEARDGFSLMCSHSPRSHFTIKLENIAEKLKASKSSRSTSQMIPELLKIIEPENIAERIKASKPSRSSSPITMDMVGFVESLFGSVHRALFFISAGPPVSVLDKKLRHVRVFFTFIAKRCIEHESVKDLFTYVEDVAYTTAQLCLLGSSFNMDCELAKLLERISRPFSPELRQIYLSALIGLKSSRSKTTMNAKYMLDFVSALQEDLRLRCDDRIRWLQRGLSYLSRFLRDIESYPVSHKKLGSLLLNMEVLAIGAANAIYSYDEGMDKTTEIDHVLFHLLLKFNYVRVEVDLIRLQNIQDTIIVPMKDMIDYVWEELMFFRSYFMDAFEQCKEQTKIIVILTSIQSAVSQAWSVCDSLCHDLDQKDLAREIKCLHFQLLLKFKFIKAAMRQMCPSISASSTPDHPMIDLLTFLPMNFEAIDSYFGVLKSSNSPGNSQGGTNHLSSSHSPNLDEVLMRFHEYILDNLLLKDETKLTFTVADEVKKFYDGLLLMVTYFIEPLVPHTEYKKQNNPSTGNETIAIEAKSAVCLYYEDTMNSNKCREVNLVLKFLTVAFWLIKSEGSLMDLLKHKSTLEAQVLDLIESAHEELILLRAILMDLLRQKLNKLDDLLMHAEVTAKRLAIFSFSCYESCMNRSSTEKMRPLLSDFLQEIETVKVEFRNVCFQVLDVSPCTMTDGEGLINFLLNHQDKVPNYDAVYSDGSFTDGSSTEKIGLPLADFRRESESVEVEEVRKLCDQVLDASPCEMSKTDGEGFINLLVTQQDKVLDYDAGSISYLVNQISLVKVKLLHIGSLLVDIVQYRNMHIELKDLAERVQAKHYICFFSVKGYEHVWYHALYLSDVKQLLKFVEAEVKMICLKVPDSSSYSFPKTNGLGYLNCFLGKLEELLRSKLDLIIHLKHQIESVKEGLLCVRSFIDHFSESYDEHDEAYGLITSVSAMAYKAEYVIDSCLAYSHPLWYKVLWISEVFENIKLVNKVVRKTCERKKIEVTVHEVAKTSSTNLAPSFSDNTLRENEEMEGFQDIMDELKEKLLGGSPQLDVISIVGMPGLGKTTLAKKIYNDPVVNSRFDVHAQCVVTQLYSWRELLLTILNDVLEPSDRNEKEDGEIADELRRFLLTKRFLILIDDVWDGKVWDNLYMCFRDVWNGSRIILTTRLSDVANYVKCESDPHHLRLFRNDESWTLLQKQVFQGESCPPELKGVGFEIAKSCSGLPLSVVLVAGVLKQKNKTLDSWKAVEQSLGSQSIGSLEESISIIGFSYKNLPHYLKPCFLYFGGFLQGKDIHVSKLTKLWVAEGFVQGNKEKGQEDAAQGFLDDLIRRNLVMGVEKRPNAKVKTCRIHDLLHKFCMEKAKQENFLLQLNSGEDVFPKQLEEYRLFVHSYQDEIDSWRPSRSNVRSLLFNAIDPDNLLWPRDISFIFESFKLVKVLDLESFNIGGTFPTEIQYLIQMKYFAAQTDANSIPSSIAKLENLETFVVRGLGGEMILPISLLKMVKLRHIHVNDRVSFSLHENMDESTANSQLANLETFSTPRLSYGEDAEKILRKMPNLRKLSCIFSGTFGYSRKMGRCVRFPRLDFLGHLESLNLVSNSYPAKLPHKFNFPSQLRELTLSKFRLSWTQISTIAELPNLVILKLLLRAFEGDHWEVKDSEFHELRYLKLDNLKLAQWSVSDDAFPKLEHLVLTKCKQLEKIPSHFGDAVSLNRIEVNWCNWSVANSAQEIQTTQHEDMANDSFTVTIQPPDWSKRSSP